LNKEAEHIPILHEFSRKINQPPALVILGVLAILLLIILFGFAGGLLTTVIGVVYPSFKSIQALESKSDSEDDK
jgi:ABC-type polysaccharide/polyol phosphate export permease